MSQRKRNEEIQAGSIEEESRHTSKVQEAIDELRMDHFERDKIVSGFLKKGLELQEVIAILIANGYKREEIEDIVSRQQKTDRVSIQQRGVHTILPVLQWIKDLEMATDTTYNNAKGRAAMAIAIESP